MRILCASTGSLKKQLDRSVFRVAWLDNPFPFMELQDVQELTNFFERRVSAYQVAVQGEICFDARF